MTDIPDHDREAHDHLHEQNSHISGAEEGGVSVHGHSHLHGHGDDSPHYAPPHRHIHSEREKKAVTNRLSRAIGHLESVKRMVERDEDCSDVLIQLAAVRNAINNTGKVIMKNHISHCIVEAIEANDMGAVEELNEAIDYFIK